MVITILLFAKKQIRSVNLKLHLWIHSKCFIIDDEPLARKGIEEYVNEIDFLTFKRQENPVKHSVFYANTKLISSLDIQMPKMSGIDFIRNLKIHRW